MLRGWPYFFMIRLRGFSGAPSSRLGVTTAARTSPSCHSARWRPRRPGPRPTPSTASRIARYHSTRSRPSTGGPQARDGSGDGVSCASGMTVRSETAMESRCCCAALWPAGVTVQRGDLAELLLAADRDALLACWGGLKFNVRGLRWTARPRRLVWQHRRRGLILPAGSRLHGLARGVDTTQLLDA